MCVCVCVCGGGGISYTLNVKHIVGWTLRKVLPFCLVGHCAKCCLSVLKTLVPLQLHHRKNTRLSKPAELQCLHSGVERG